MQTFKAFRPVVSFVSLFFISAPLWAMTYAPSAARAPGEDYLRKIQQYSRFESEDTLSGKSALNSAGPLESLDASQVQEWPADQDFGAYFAQIRDERMIQTDPDFPRRSTWLYPDDGCYARAALSAARTRDMHLPAPSRIFVFGNLNVKTGNAPQGSVSWWYHVVIAYRLNGEVLVVDPAIQPRYPLKLADWLSTMGKTENMKVAFCSDGAYEPYSKCQGGEGMDIGSSLYAQSSFLSLEWRRLESLGRDPQQELGENPPWLAPQNPPVEQQRPDQQKPALPPDVLP